MAKMIKVASRLPMAVALREPNPNPDKPGETPTLRSVTLASAPHPGGETISTVDAELFAAWKDGNPNHDWLSGDLVREVPDDHEADGPSFGHEPGVEAWSQNADNVKLAEQGTEGEAGLPVTAEDMAATSDTPNDDSPRSDVGGPGGRRARVVKTSDIPGPVPGENA